MGGVIFVMKKILITGALGFAGHHMARFFEADAKYEAVFHARSPASEVTNSEKFIFGDLADLNFCREMIEVCAPSAIVHCAGRVPYKSKSVESEDFFQDNSSLVANLVRACEDSMVGALPHIIFPSTAAMYPITRANGILTVDDFLRNKEIIPLCDEMQDIAFDEMGVYGQSKIRGEEEIRKYSGPWSILRKATIVGPDDVRGNFVSELVWGCLNGVSYTSPDKMNMLGGIRDYLTVNDMYRAVDLCVRRPASYSQTMNITSSIPVSGYEVLQCMQSLLSEFNIASLASTQVDPRFVLLQNSVVLDGRKAMNLIGFQAQDLGVEAFRAVANSYADPRRKQQYIKALSKVLGIK